MGAWAVGSEWFHGLVTRIGLKNWFQGLITRIGGKNWFQGLISRRDFAQL